MGQVIHAERGAARRRSQDPEEKSDMDDAKSFTRGRTARQLTTFNAFSAKTLNARKGPGFERFTRVLVFADHLARP